MEVPPGELARLKWAQAGAAYTAGASALRLSLLRRSISRTQAADLQDLDAECFEPGQQALEGRLIPDLAMDDGLDGLYRGCEPVEVEQGFGRQDTGYADLVVRR